MKAGRILTALVISAAVGLGLVLFVGSGLSQDQHAAACRPSQSVTVAGGDLPGEIAGWSGEQLANAATIIRAGADLGVDARGQAIAVMTAMGEVPGERRPGRRRARRHHRAVPDRPRAR